MNCLCNLKHPNVNQFILLSIGSIMFFSCTKTNTSNSINANNVSHQVIETDYLGFDSYGQSLSIGGDAGKTAYLASTIQKFNSVMPNLGVRSLDYPKLIPTSFVPLVEQLNANGTMGETLCSGACEMFAQAYPERPFILKGVASGYGGQTVAQLSKGTPRYKQYMKDITNAYKTAQSMGNSYALGMSGWTQGEADIEQGTTYDTYKTALLQLYSDINTDVPDTTLQTNTIPFIVGQISSTNRTTASMSNPEIALAQLDLCVNNPGFTLATPMYFLDFITDNTHLTGANYRILAAYYGYAAKKFVIDDEKNFIYLTQLTEVSSDIYLVFNVPVAPLFFDTSRVKNPGDYGFTVKNSSGKKMKLKMVEILGGDSVHIKCANTPAGGILSYAINGNSRKAGRTLGPRGCMRDSQGDSIIFDPGDSTHTNFPLYNWCPIFKAQL